MQESINGRIGALRVRKEQLAERMRSLESSANELDYRQTELKACKDKLNLAKKKVDSFKGLSPRNLVTSLLGSKFDALRLAEDELREVSQVYETCLAKVRQLRSDKESLQSCHQELAVLEADLTTALATKERIVERNLEASELGSFNARIAELRTRQKELAEAVEAGVVADEHLKDVIKSLDSAAGWGAWDMLGGGLLATAVKHSRLDDARAHAERAGQACRRFAKELGDVNMRLSSSLEIDGFIRFADYFFDNLFTDWAVQTKIGDALEQAKRQEREVDMLVCKLRAEQSSLGALLTNKLQEKADYIASL